MTQYDNSPLTTERVTTSRRAPLAVVLVVFAVVALLLWKPWVGPVTPSPSPGPVAARPTPSPTLVPVPPLAPTPAPTPTPVIPNVDVESIIPFVECGYEPGPRRTNVLSNITLFPPLVVLHPDGVGEPITQVRWRAVVESNLQQTLFTAPWDRVTASRWRPAPDRADTSTTLRAIRIDYTKRPVGQTVVVRVEVVVQWLGPDRLLRGSQSVVPTSYRQGDTGPILSEGCSAIT